MRWSIQMIIRSNPTNHYFAARSNNYSCNNNHNVNTEYYHSYEDQAYNG